MCSIKQPENKAPLVNPSRTSAILRKFGFRFTRAFGQNFLIDPNTLRKIIGAADLQPDDVVLEIGAGIGTLTEALAAGAAHVITVEIDKKLAPVLDETLAGLENVTVRRMDAMDLKAEETEWAGRPANKLVANLPYGIAAPLILKAFNEFRHINTMVVMVQREIAARMLAQAGSKNYSGFTVKLQYFCQVKWLLSVSSRVFMPAPNVDSAVILLIRWEKPPIGADKDRLFAIVSGGFSQRRKQLANALASALDVEKATIETALREVGLAPKVRAENLALADFAALAERLEFRGR
ncbi:MAG: 16S rRNA (adenine(1518)-N(6)/adenine(1519)-N(6))-dimethyltransferase RsmA [Actinomycetota bacterium]|nr:16S rRNA (adenine(1518)-N(6)/adenine(1519)-N(6))-dimethyltransferase RsmA [Actinomycetota bacterium]